VSILAYSQQHFCSVTKSNSRLALMKGSPDDRPQKLMAAYDLKFHHLDITVERTSTYIKGFVRTMFQTQTALDTFVFELHANLSVDSCLFGNVKLSVTRVGSFCYASLGRMIPKDTVASVYIYYKGTPPADGGAAIGNGFSNKTSPSWGNQITYSLSQPYSAYEWWPCKQSLQDKIDSVYIFVTTDSTNKAGSNGLLKNIVNIGSKKRYEWKHYHLIDYYLISVSVGKYIDYSFYAHPSNSDSVFIQNYIYDNPATLVKFKPTIDSVRQMIELMSGLFGPYRFANEKYGHCMAPLSGGMEHQTMTTLGNFDYLVTAHELGHMWFGDNVTCATWNDIWLNEGFASYVEYLTYQYMVPTEAAGKMAKVHSIVMSDAGGSAWFSDTSDVPRVFDSRLTYNKGSAIIHTLRFELNNDTLFFNILRSYQQRFNHSTASVVQFKALVEELSGRSFTQFFNQWYYGQGYPIFEVRWNQKSGNLYIKNIQTVSSITPLFKTPLEYKITRNIGDTIIRVSLNQNIENFEIPMTGTVLNIEVDPSNWLLNSTMLVTKDLTLASDEINNPFTGSDISVYPNPTNGEFEVFTREIIKEMILLNIEGKHIYSFPATTKLDVKNLDNGVYFLQIKTENTQKIIKLLKQ